MSILVVLLIAILIAAVAIYAVDFLPIDARLAGIIKFVIVIIALLFVVQRAGYIA